MKLWQAQILVALKLATINDGRVRFFWERGNQKQVKRLVQYAMWTSGRSRKFGPVDYYFVRDMITGSNLSWQLYIDGAMKKWQTL